MQLTFKSTLVIQASEMGGANNLKALFAAWFDGLEVISLYSIV